MRIILNNDKPIKSWADPLEETALQQARNLSNHPEVCGHVALMPDCHTGYGMPIGGVICCFNTVIPNAVGVDIGCGMAFQKTNIRAEEISTAQLKSIVRIISNEIPVGFNHNKVKTEWDDFNDAPDDEIIQQNLDLAAYSLGTLGGGNHFIELQVNTEGFLCVMIHSGSRNLGYKICKHFNKIANELNEKMNFGIDPKWDLAYLPLTDVNSIDYLCAMDFALSYAKENRNQIITKVLRIIEYKLDTSIKVDVLDVHHNYAALEPHMDKRYYVHRKGAIRARKGELGIIPGSMETPSYIVEGLGEAESFNSASHGAGRIMSRNQAKKTLSLEDAKIRLKEKNILFTSSNGILDEVGPAYKDIDAVLEAEKDLVTILDKLNQIAVIKG